EALAEAAETLAGDRLVQSQLPAPERLASECIVAKDLAAFLQHPPRVFLDWVEGLGGSGRRGFFPVRIEGCPGEGDQYRGNCNSPGNECTRHSKPPRAGRDCNLQAAVLKSCWWPRGDSNTRPTV